MEVAWEAEQVMAGWSELAARLHMERRHMGRVGITTEWELLLIVTDKDEWEKMGWVLRMIW